MKINTLRHIWFCDLEPTEEQTEVVSEEIALSSRMDTLYITLMTADSCIQKLMSVDGSEEIIDKLQGLPSDVLIGFEG